MAFTFLLRCLYNSIDAVNIIVQSNGLTIHTVMTQNINSVLTYEPSIV